MQFWISILVTVCRNSLRLKKQKSDKQTKNKNKWFDSDCYTYNLQKQIRCSSRKLKSCANSNNIKEFRLSCKQYKNLLRKKKREYKQKLLDKMSDLKQMDPKLYWNILLELKECEKGASSGNVGNSILGEEWYAHFSKLA